MTPDAIRARSLGVKLDDAVADLPSWHSLPGCYNQDDYVEALERAVRNLMDRADWRRRYFIALAYGALITFFFVVVVIWTATHH